VVQREVRGAAERPARGVEVPRPGYIRPAPVRRRTRPVVQVRLNPMLQTGFAGSFMAGCLFVSLVFGSRITAAERQRNRSVKVDTLQGVRHSQTPKL
jgi:hypothetical protein